MPNRLAQETSPYLLQHANNPVDWYPWGPEALERAAREDRPILLSIGYAACHWCHVMEHESFENEDTARLMNERFVNIKVDREERPDLDSIYMTAVQAITGHGGWPMTMFLTPVGAPFYAGTYFPPEDRHGMPSFKRVLSSAADAYANRRGDVERMAGELRQMYERASQVLEAGSELSSRTLENGYRGIAQRYDMRHGGFEGAPKFPQTMALEYLLRYWSRTGTGFALEMALESFRKMARGGIYDQVGGGFHRYSVDAAWLVPHFEKMLYDNALLVQLGVHLFQATGDAEIRRVTEETLRWLEREITAPEGGFYSSLDADSEGEEGKFYVWSEEGGGGELNALLGPDVNLVKQYYNVVKGGNFEGRSILHVPAEPATVAARAGVGIDRLEEAIARAKAILYDARDKRVWPARDDKILASWNGLMLRAVAEAARVFGHASHRKLAERNADFLFREMVRDGRAMRSHKGGVTKLNGYLEDHCALGLGALAMYELTFERRWLENAITLAESAIEWFWEGDRERGMFFDTARDHEALITRPRETSDNATPSGTSLAIDLLLRLADLTQNEHMGDIARRSLASLAEPMTRYGAAFGHALVVADMAVHGATEVAVVGNPGDAEFRELERELASHYVPALILAGGRPDDPRAVALLSGRQMLDGKATAYVCRGRVCDEPVTDAVALSEQLAATLLPTKR